MGATAIVRSNTAYRRYRSGNPVGINANNDVALVHGYRSYFWNEGPA